MRRFFAAKRVQKPKTHNLFLMIVEAATGTYMWSSGITSLMTVRWSLNSYFDNIFDFLGASKINLDQRNVQYGVQRRYGLKYLKYQRSIFYLCSLGFP
jgi:hypothetical protein